MKSMWSIDFTLGFNYLSFYIAGTTEVDYLDIQHFLSAACPATV